MDDTQLAAVAVIVAAAVLEALKDHLNLGSPALRWVAAVIGALVGGGASYVEGGVTASGLATNIGLGALIMTGFHSLVLQDALPGRVLKAIGDALLKKP